MNPKTLSIKEIMDILPHRYPFLLVDRIVAVDLEKKTITGQKNLTMNESFFQGHFPGAPIMPGVLIIEALAQTATVMLKLKFKLDKIAVLLNIKNAKFRSPVKPGDVLTLSCEGLHFSSKGGRVLGIAKCGDQLAAEAEIGFALVEKAQI